VAIISFLAHRRERKNRPFARALRQLGPALDSISIQFEDIFYGERKTSCCLMWAWPRARAWTTTDGLGDDSRGDLGGDLGDDLGDDLGENVGRDLAREPEHSDGEPEGGAADGRVRVSPALQREEDERANSLGLVITAAMLFVLFAAAMLFGSHGTIGSMRHSSSPPGAKAMGNLLYGGQGASSCPQISFDSATGSVPGPTERCLARDGDAAGHPHD